MTPSGASSTFMAPTKSLRSGTWASTLLPRSRSARRCAASFVATGTPKNSTSVGTPFSTATSATLAAGSMPRTDTPRATKYCSR
jgi:hypothetical protein